MLRRGAFGIKSWQAAAGGGSASLLDTSDLSLAGYFGIGHNGLTGYDDNSMNYACGPAAIRYVGGARKLLMGSFTSGGTDYYNQSWRVGDLIEFNEPASYSATGTQPATLNDVTVRKRWPMSEWHLIGACEPGAGLVPGWGWWDEANGVFWYCLFQYYSANPSAAIFAVGLNEDQTCTKYGPWHYGDWTASDWKHICMWITEIPAAQRASMQNRTHLMGGCTMSMGAQANWGLGLTAINLPTLTPAVSGVAEATVPAAGTTFTIHTTQDLSSVPTDGSVVFFLSYPYTSYPPPHAAVSNWKYYTRPVTITETSPDVWTIVGTETLYGATAEDEINWALTYVMSDAGVPIADFSPATSGLTAPDHHQKRPATYSSPQTDHDLTSDPDFGGRIGAGSVFDGQDGKTALGGSTTTIQLASDASASNDYYNGKYIQLRNNTPSGAYLQSRVIADYDGSTKTATVRTWDGGISPTNSTTYRIVTKSASLPADWLGQSTAIPPIDGTRGYWQASIDAANGCAWVQTSTKEGVLLFGEMVSGGTWYHFSDTYKYWDHVSKATAGSWTEGSYGYHADVWSPQVFLYDPSHLREVAAGTRLANANGMEFIDGGDWHDVATTQPGYRESTVYPGETCWIKNPAGGGGGLLLWDATAEQLVWINVEVYQRTGGLLLPLVTVFDVG